MGKILYINGQKMVKNGIFFFPNLFFLSYKLDSLKMVENYDVDSKMENLVSLSSSQMKVNQ